LWHRATDAAGWRALDRDHGRAPRPGELETRHMNSEARVLLATLSVRTSAKGRKYLSGFLGRTKLLGFPGEPDKFGHETFDLFIAEAPPKPALASTASAVPRPR
jgi:hypothetical protein